MKKILSFAIFSSILVSTASSGGYKSVVCKKDFYEDPCPLDSYSIVETEGVFRSRHNWMKAGDTLDTDIITCGVGREKRRNLPREAYFYLPKSAKACR